MTHITDELMMQPMTTVKTYTVVIRKAGPAFEGPDAKQIAWEHGRRNFALRAEGILPVVCPVTDNSDIKEIGIFNADVTATQQIMDADPDVQARVFAMKFTPAEVFRETVCRNRFAAHF